MKRPNLFSPPTLWHVVCLMEGSECKGHLITPQQMGGKKMKRCMITITTLLEDDTRQTVVLDVSEGDVFANCPRSSGIEIESFKRDSEFEVVLKIPHSNERFHFQFKNFWTKGGLDRLVRRAA